jgi:predicted transcriptional regulator of viral defense system
MHEHTHTLALPMGYRVTFKFAPATHTLSVEWAPDVPSLSSPRHRRKFFEAYKAARRDFFTNIATTIGGSVRVADLNGETEVMSPGTKH